MTGCFLRDNTTIVNIIGVAGERHRSNYIAGTTGNAVLMAFTRALGSESVDYGVRTVGGCRAVAAAKGMKKQGVTTDGTLLLTPLRY